MYKPKIFSIDLTKEVLELSAEIQNKGIATVFFRLHGHINEAQVDIHFPQWESGKRADKTFSFYCDNVDDSESKALKVISDLKDILENGHEYRDEAAEIVRQERFNLFQQLQKEFSNELIAD